MPKSKKSLLDNDKRNSVSYTPEDALVDTTDLADFGDYLTDFYKEMEEIDKDNEIAQRQKPRPTWDDMYMEIAEVVAKRSKDPHTKVGAVIVKDNHILGIGYNAEPRGFSYDFDWNSTEKYDYVIHAELNAIANSTFFGNSIVGSTIYLTLSPCHECMKLLIQYGIETIYYKEKYKDFELSEKMAKHSKIKLIQYNSN